MDVSPPLSVTELSARIKQTLEQGFAHIKVQGEISRLTRPSSGHIYFTIKDAHASISAALWRSAALRLNTQPKEGQSFVFSGHLSLYEPRGTYQLIVTAITPIGAGQLAAEFERRKALFAQRGWFESSHKHNIPKIPQHIGIITSTTAAAFEDVKKVLKTRPAFLQITLSPCLVQGAQAPAQIAQSISKLELFDSPPDVILLVRGGGSMEDLWCFNDEIVIKAIAEAHIPIISGIGHEIDTTLADLAADLRAATPSNAAELCCPSTHNLQQRIPAFRRLSHALQGHVSRALQHLNMQQQRLQHAQQRLMDEHLHQDSQLEQRLEHAFKNNIHTYQNKFSHLKQRLIPQAPGKKLQQQQHVLHRLENKLFTLLSTKLHHDRQRLQHQQEQISTLSLQNLHQKQRLCAPIFQRLAINHASLTAHPQQQYHTLHKKIYQSFKSHLQQQRHQLQVLHEKLQALDPQHVLQRGYSLNYDAQGKLIRHAQALQTGELIHIHLHDGIVDSRIENIQHKEKI